MCFGTAGPANGGGASRHHRHCPKEEGTRAQRGRMRPLGRPFGRLGRCQVGPDNTTAPWSLGAVAAFGGPHVAGSDDDVGRHGSRVAVVSKLSADGREWATTSSSSIATPTAGSGCSSTRVRGVLGNRRRAPCSRRLWTAQQLRNASHSGRAEVSDPRP